MRTVEARSGERIRTPPLLESAARRRLVTGKIHGGFIFRGPAPRGRRRISSKYFLIPGEWGRSSVVPGRHLTIFFGQAGLQIGEPADTYMESWASVGRSRQGGPPVYDRSVTEADCRPETRGRPGRVHQKAEFAGHLAQHQGQLLGYIYSLVRDLDDADDLFQQTSLVLWDKFDQFDARGASWLGLRRGAYEVLNFLRSRSRDRLYFSDELSLALIEAQEELEQEQLEERRDGAGGLHEEDCASATRSCWRRATAGRPASGRWPGPAAGRRRASTTR